MGGLFYFAGGHGDPPLHWGVQAYTDTHRYIFAATANCFTVYAERYIINV